MQGVIGKVLWRSNIPGSWGWVNKEGITCSCKEKNSKAKIKLIKNVKILLKKIMWAFTWLSTYHLQGKEQWSAPVSSIKQMKGSTIHQSNKRGCMFSQHWMGTLSSCCWMSLSRNTIQQTRDKCPTNQCWAVFKRVFKVSGSRHRCIWKTNK